MRPPGAARSLALIRVLLFFCLLGGLLTALAREARADVTLYRGAEPLGTVPSAEGPGGPLVDLEAVGRLLGFSASKNNDETTLTRGGTKVRVIQGATVAWRGLALTPLHAAPVLREGRLWVDTSSAAALFQGLTGSGRLRFLSGRGPRTPATAQASSPPSPSPPPSQLVQSVSQPVQPPAVQEPSTPTPPVAVRTTPAPATPAPVVPTPATPVPTASVPAARGGRPVVVVDPGHGGKDPGTSAHGVVEKNVNLAIGLDLERELKAKGFDVVMTRRTDVYLKLQERTEIANRANADVFVSVHVNALPSASKTSGFEIYLMALPTDKDALALAKIENRELAGEMDGGSEAADKRTETLLRILGDMQQNNKINESTGLAEALFSAGKREGLPMRRVAQAPFFVLRGAAMPAVLLETGFVTNATEAKLLAHSGYQQKIAQVMADGVAKYLGR